MPCKLERYISHSVSIKLYQSINVGEQDEREIDLNAKRNIQISESEIKSNFC